MGKQSNKKATSASSNNNAEDHHANNREHPLQAVLLADPFSDAFKPLSFDRSAPLLCPLNNVILLDYTLDFCAGASIRNLIVVCTDDAVEAHVLNWKNNNTTSMDITILKDTSLTNAGDALRELDKRNIVQSDPFVLIHGDVISNVDLQAALKAHKERHQQDSSAIMTLLFKPASQWSVVSSNNNTNKATYSTIRASTEDLVVGLDTSTPVAGNAPRIFVYDDKPSEGLVPLPCSFLTTCPRLDMRCDLLDCGIDLCSPDVLARFSDEFDYRDIRREFVANSVAEEEEGLQSKLYAYLLQPHEYAARVVDFRTYAALSHDLLRRWCYPIVPDNLPSGYEQRFRYVQQRQYCYRERKGGRTHVGRSTLVQNGGMMGSHCVVGENCIIEGSVLGNHVRVGNNVTLRNCHVWDGVCIEDGATVLQSILSYECNIKAGATVSRGCLIGERCIIGTNIKLPEFCRITTVSQAAEQSDDDDEFDDFESDESEDEQVNKTNKELSNSKPATTSVGKDDDQQDEIETDHDIVGPDGRGRIWLPSVDDSDDEDDDEEQENNLRAKLLEMKSRSIGFDPTRLYIDRKQRQEEDVEDDGFSDDNDDDDVNNMDMEESNENDYSASAAANIAFGENTTSTAATASLILPGATTSPQYGRQAGVDVVKELKTICLEFEPSNPMENLAIELNSYKFSQNATYSDCCMGATLAILELMKITKGMSDGKLVAGLKSHLEVWGPLLKRLSIGAEEEKAIIVALENAAIGGGDIGEKLSTGPSFRFVLQTLHDEEFIGEETILSWASERRTEIAKGGDDNARMQLFQLQPVQDFLEWLEEETDEDDSGEEDGSDDGDSE